MSELNKNSMDGNIFGIALNYKCLYEKLQAQFNEKPYINEPKKPVLFIKTPIRVINLVNMLLNKKMTFYKQARHWVS